MWFPPLLFTILILSSLQISILLENGSSSKVKALCKAAWSNRTLYGWECRCCPVRQPPAVGGPRAAYLLVWQGTLILIYLNLISYLWGRKRQPCLENPMDRGAWQAIVHRVAKSWTQLKRLSTHTMKKVQETLHSLRLCFPNCLQISMFAHWSLLSETSWGTCPTSGKTTSLWRRSFSGVAAHRRLGCDSLFALDAQEQI